MSWSAHHLMVYSLDNHSIMHPNVDNSLWQWSAGRNLTKYNIYTEFVCSRCVCVGLIQILQLPLTHQILKYKIKKFHWNSCGIMWLKTYKNWAPHRYSIVCLKCLAEGVLAYFMVFSSLGMLLVFPVFLSESGTVSHSMFLEGSVREMKYPEQYVHMFFWPYEEKHSANIQKWDILWSNPMYCRRPFT